MTDRPLLTDEELALWKREARLGLGTRDTERIIAEVERLRATNAELRAEIASLKYENEQLEKWVPSGW